MSETDPFDPKQETLSHSALDDPRLLSGQFWGELRVFLAVAKAKSFNRATEALNMSQPSVSRQIKRLHDLVGTQLLVSTKQGIKLTPKGEELARSLSNFDQAIAAITSDLRASSRDMEGVVRISITDGLGGVFVAPRIAAFSAAYPRIQLHLKTPSHISSLRDNQTDMMLGFAPVDSPDFSTRQLGWLHFIPVAARTYVESSGLPTRNNLAQHRFLHSEFYAARTGLWDRWQQMVEIGTIAHYCDSSFAYALLVKAGLGIGLLGSYTTADPDALPLELDLAVRVPIYAIALNERLRSRPVRIAFDWLCDIFGPDNPWFSSELNITSLQRDSLGKTVSLLLAGREHAIR